METRQITPFFTSTFCALTGCNIYFCFENSQNSFSCALLFGPFWSVKCLNFEQKLPIRTAHHTFVESRHTEVTKNPYYVLSPEGSLKKGFSSWTKYLISLSYINILYHYHYLFIKSSLNRDVSPTHLKLSKVY